jgi:hypothetical protein
LNAFLIAKNERFGSQSVEMPVYHASHFIPARLQKVAIQCQEMALEYTM